MHTDIHSLIQHATVSQDDKAITLLFERFKLNDPIRDAEDKEVINPAYYDKSDGAFDLRSKSNSRTVDYGRVLYSSY